MATLTRETLLGMTKPQIIVELKNRKIQGYSGLKKEGLINMYLNPPAPGTVRSPGRPKGTGTKAPAAPGAPKEKKHRVVDKSKVVEYNRQGLESLTVAVLKQLVADKKIEGASGKNKGALIDLILTKPHATDMIIMTRTPAGSTETVKILAAGTHAARVSPPLTAPSVVASMLTAPVLTAPGVLTAPARISPRLTAPVLTTYVPAPVFRQ